MCKGLVAICTRKGVCIIHGCDRCKVLSRVIFWVPKIVRNETCKQYGWDEMMICIDPYRGVSILKTISHA